MLYEIYNGGRFISRGKGEHPTRIIDTDELIFVLQGTLDMFECEQQFNVRKGEWLILHRGKRHGGKALYPKNLSFFWLHFRDLDGWLERLPQHGQVENPSVISGYIQNFLNEQTRLEPDKNILDLLFQLIFAELRRKTVPDPDRTPLAIAAKNYVDLHFMEPVNLCSAAEELKCNTEYLGRLFHRCYGESFVAYLNRKRIERAAGYLADGAYSVKEIIELCGFRDPAYFRRKFRSCYNQSPGEYRDNHSGGHRNTL